MNVLVVGASGFIGRNLLKVLPEDVEIIALYHRSADFPDFVRSSGFDHVQPVRVDLTDADQVRSQLRGVEDFDAVFYLAANGDPTVSVEQPGFDLRINALALVNLLEICGAGHFIYMSSGAVYDGLKGPVSPAVEVAPRLPYAIAKLAAEHYLHFFHQWQGQIARLTILRFFGAFGPHEPARKFYTRLVQAFAFEGEREFVVRGDGTNLIDAMYVDDTVRALLQVWQSEGDGGVFDFGSGEPLTIDELVRRAAATFGVEELEIEHRGSTAEPIEFSIDPQPFCQRFAFGRQYSLEEGLLSLHAFLEENRVALSH